MDALIQKELYDKITIQIQRKSNIINEILSNPSVKSNYLTKKTYENFEQVFKEDTSSCINKESCDKQYDSEIIKSIFTMLNTGKTTHSKIMIRSASMRSMSLTSLNSEHDDNLDEVIKQMQEVCTLIDSLKNTPLEIPNLSEINSLESSKRSSFIDLVCNLQKFAKEIRKIAATDCLSNHTQSIQIEKSLISDLKHLNQVGCIKVNSTN